MRPDAKHIGLFSVATPTAGLKAAWAHIHVDGTYVTFFNVYTVLTF